MINIVTGKINSGKTTRMQKLYQANKQGDGIIFIKEMHQNHPKRYQAKRLKTGEKFEIILRDSYQPEDYKTAFQIGPYGFNQSGVDRIETLIKQWLSDDTNPIFFDEVGILEVQKEGFYPLIKQLVKSDKTLYISLRKNLLDAFLKTFKITNYQIVRSSHV